MIIAAFEPLEDITVFELALCVANMGSNSPPKRGILFPDEAWNELDLRIKRHFNAIGDMV